MVLDWILNDWLLDCPLQGLSDPSSLQILSCTVNFTGKLLTVFPKVLTGGTCFVISKFESDSDDIVLSYLSLSTLSSLVFKTRSRWSLSVLAKYNFFG